MPGSAVILTEADARALSAMLADYRGKRPYVKPQRPPRRPIVTANASSVRGVPSIESCNCAGLERPGSITTCSESFESHESYKFSLVSDVEVYDGSDSIPTGVYRVEYVSSCTWESAEFSLNCGGSDDTYIWRLSGTGGIGGMTLELVRTAGTNCTVLTLSYTNTAPFQYLGSNSMSISGMSEDIDGTPQCRFCLEPVGPDCEACNDGAPFGWQVTLSGITTNTCDSNACTDLNGTWELPYTDYVGGADACRYLLNPLDIPSAGCSGATPNMSVQLFGSGATSPYTIRLQISVGFGTAAQYDGVYTALTLPDCTQPIVLPLANTPGSECATWPSSVTINPI